ncbi:MAG: hypothetical protein RR911_04735 [Oscillospiraceae bacterium]
MANYTHDTTVDELLKDPKAVEVIERFSPGITKNPAIKMVKKFKLEKLTHITQVGLSIEKLDELLKEINEA